jgi:hypothetical protein
MTTISNATSSPILAYQKPDSDQANRSDQTNKSAEATREVRDRATDAVNQNAQRTAPSVRHSGSASPPNLVDIFA